LADGDPGFTDLGDKNRPQKLGEKFAELFDESWASAYESLKPKNPEPDADDDDETKYKQGQRKAWRIHSPKYLTR
jgi:hypothetical protein